MRKQALMELVKSVETKPVGDTTILVERILLAGEFGAKLWLSPAREVSVDGYKEQVAALILLDIQKAKQNLLETGNELWFRYFTQLRGMLSPADYEAVWKGEVTD